VSENAHENHERTAVFVARAWLHGEPPTLAATVTYSLDVSEPGRVTLALSGAKQITDAVVRWLDELVAAETADGDGPVTDG
jgi:hypothetical protein